jgi:predicted TIM-barrel fold metal-dependent hydrolase
MSLPSEIQRSISQLIFGGTFERFPRLKIVSAENDIGWIPYFLYRADRGWKRFRYLESSELTKAPSEYLKQNIWCTFIDDPVGLELYRRIGADNIMWSNDYPHQASTWPHSLEVIERDFVGVDEADKVKICRDNVAKLYGFDLAVLDAQPLAATAAD